MLRTGVQLREGLRQVGFAELVDHGHDQIRGIGAQQFLQLLDAVGHLDRKADALAGLRELAFELGAVGDEDHLPVRRAEAWRYISRTMNIMVSDLPEPWVCQMMPLRSRGFLPFQQALHRQLDGAELLVAAHDLDGLAFVVGGKQREGADEVEQVVAVEHPGDEALLVVGAAGAVFQIVHRARDTGRPSGRSAFSLWVVMVPNLASWRQVAMTNWL